MDNCVELKEDLSKVYSALQIIAIVTKWRLLYAKTKEDMTVTIVNCDDAIFDNIQIMTKYDSFLTLHREGCVCE
ncbi:MAG: hypothetical protein LBS29_04230 [Endomicrobium sp.]|jgi:hypothetical protein|nr:hypothetical protein [Endomicrobium sp.]